MLVGKASHPVAEAHIQLACQARTHLAKKVAVHNVVPKKDTYYKVFCDLDCLGGKEGVQVSSGGTAGYTMHILAPRPGVFNGSITFMADSGKLKQMQKGKAACDNRPIAQHKDYEATSAESRPQELMAPSSGYGTCLYINVHGIGPVYWA